MLRRILWSSMFLMVTACATKPPVIEYTIARSALDAAKGVSAARYAPAYWHKAEQRFRAGEDSYREEKYSQAAEAFLKTRMYAEKAENIARLERFKNGEF